MPTHFSSRPLDKNNFSALYAFVSECVSERREILVEKSDSEYPRTRTVAAGKACGLHVFPETGEILIRFTKETVIAEYCGVVGGWTLNGTLERQMCVSATRAGEILRFSVGEETIARSPLFSVICSASFR